jgi:threonine synthase
VPVAVKPSVAQAAMIGNPVSMPRVIHLVDRYDEEAGRQRVFFVEVTEQAIMDWELLANRNGHIACTHGGESLAGLVTARKQGLVDGDDIAVIDSTAHALKFAGFQQMYFEQQFPPEYGITVDPQLVNAPLYLQLQDLEKLPAPGNPLNGLDLDLFVQRVSEEIADRLNLKKP